VVLLKERFAYLGSAQQPPSLGFAEVVDLSKPLWDQAYRELASVDIGSVISSLPSVSIFPQSGNNDMKT
jgi:hypothetical protein